MKCEICNKNQANIILTIVFNDKNENFHVCSDCMQMIYMQAKSPLNPFEMIFGEIANKKLDLESVECNKCGTKYYDFLVNNKYGCIECYELFNSIQQKNNNIIKDKVDNYVNRKGTVAMQSKIQDDNFIKEMNKYFEESKDNMIKIIRMKNELRKAIEMEDYKKAQSIQEFINSYDSCKKI